MSIFQMYLKLGLEHILDFNGYDHILFLTSLMAVYQFKQWKKVLKLVTAFTIGHSISLALSVLDYISFSVPLIELLIPVTIFTTATANLINKQELSPKFFVYEYAITAVFGLIHGMGFSILLKSLLGAESSFISSLLAFNIGLEIGQIIIVSVILSIGFLAIKYILKRDYWSMGLSIISLITSSYLIYDRWIW